MPIETKPLLFSDKKELEKNLDKVVEEFFTAGISVIRGLNFTELEQKSLVQTLGDLAGWYPNTSSVDIKHVYREDHGSNKASVFTSGNDIMLDWHLEHVEYDAYIPLIGGLWNMMNFKCDKESGKTYFLDSQEAYKLLSKDNIDFLLKSVLTWKATNGTGPHFSPAIKNHWKTKNPLVRLEITESVYVSLNTFDNRPPTPREKEKFKEIEREFKYIVKENLDLRIVHKWEEGDIVIPDLFRMAHAVTGGFDPKDRKFTGMWLFAGDLEKSPKENLPNWWD